MKLKPADFIFIIDKENPDEHMFCFTEKKYWDENECLDDGEEAEVIEALLPPKFHNAMENSYHYYGENEVGYKKLIAAGFIHMPNPWDTE